MCWNSKTVQSRIESDSFLQLMLAVWLLVCLVLRASYTSSLISHLVVQGESAAINDMETLVRLHEEGGWQWGTQIFSGAFNTYLSSSLNSDYKIIKTYMQVSFTKLQMTIHKKKKNTSSHSTDLRKTNFV